MDQDNLEKDCKTTSWNETWQHIGQPPWSTHEYSMPSIRKTFCHLLKVLSQLDVRDMS